MRLLAGLLGLTALLPGSALLAADDAPKPQGTATYASVEVHGNRTAETQLVLKNAGIEPGLPVGKGRRRQAIRSLYGLGLFSQIRLYERADSLGRPVLVFDVEENPRITSLAWTGNKKLSEDDLKGKIDFRVGQILTGKKLFEARNALEQAYRDQGFASATVTPTVGPTENGQTTLTFAVEEGKKVKIVSVEFVGNESVPSSVLGKQIALKPNSLFKRKRYTAERLREDEEKLKEYYHDHGHKDAVVSDAEAVLSDDRTEVTLRHHVEEGPFYRFGALHFEGNSAVATNDLLRSAAFRAGDAFNQSKIDATTSEAYNLYTEKGYLLQLSISPETRVVADTVNVDYSVREGEPSHVHEIEIVGNTRTKERVIRRELTLIPGDLLRRSVVMRSHRDIFALGYFEDVQVDYEPTGQGSDIDVAFKVKEKSVGTATAGAGYSSDTGLTGFVEFGHNNLFGNGQSVAIHLERGGRRRTYDISFTEPWLLGTPTSAGFQVYNTQRDIDLYTEKRKGFGLNAGRPWFFKVPDYTRVSVAYALENVKFADFEGLGSETEEFLRSSNGTVSSLTTSLSRNSTNNPFYPTGGSRTVLRGEFAGGLLGGEISFFKPVLDHRNYFVPFGKPAIMLRHRLGYLGSYTKGGSVPGNETFRLGGTRADYLRGYPDYEVVPEENIHRGSDGREVRFPGGKLAYTFTAEYQFPVVNPVHGLLFFDAGNTWNSSRDFNLNDLKKGMGLGVRLEIPLLGPVGFDYAYGVDRGKWEPHFIIGPAF